MRWPRPRPQDPSMWHKWFAWYPVDLDELDCVAWLETVWRRSTGAGMNGLCWDYKPLESMKEFTSSGGEK